LDFEGEPDFPLLLKFIFPKDKLSIQVHPDDAYAAAHEKAAGGRGKTEMWHIVSADAGARLLAGLKPGVTKQTFRDAIVDGELENLFQSHDVQAGDTFFIPAGTPHTIGPDMIVCEVQEYSDLTYRVYDYGRVDSNGRPRELHVEKALEVMNFNSEKIGKVTPTGTTGLAPEGWERLVDCAYFEATRFRTNGPIRFDLVQERPAAFRLWVFLEGAGSVEWSCHPYERFTQNHGGFRYRAGECWFIPAVFGSHSFRTETKTSVLIATPHNPKLASTKNDHGE
jgi:mannose-6-phosphate isomerase